MIQYMTPLHVFLNATLIKQFSFNTLVALSVKINDSTQWKIFPTLKPVQDKKKGIWWQLPHENYFYL